VKRGDADVLRACV